MIHFKIFGIPVSIQPFFWITMVLIGSQLVGGDEKQMILLMGLFVLAGFISITVHELGHALTIKHFGLPTAITLHAFGGYATYPAGILSRPKSFMVTAAGPGIQLLLGLVSYLALKNMLMIGNSNLLYFLSILTQISWFWAILNLIPVLPLDGGQLVNALLGPERIRLTLYISIGTALLGAFLLFKFWGGLIFPIYLIFMAWESWKTLKTISPG